MSTRPVPTNLDSWPGVTDLVGSYKHMLHVLWSSPPSLVNVVGVGRPGVIERLTGATRLDEPVVLEALRELERRGLVALDEQTREVGIRRWCAFHKFVGRWAEAAFKAYGQIESAKIKGIWAGREGVKALFPLKSDNSAPTATATATSIKAAAPPRASAHGGDAAASRINPPTPVTAGGKRRRVRPSGIVTWTGDDDAEAARIEREAPDDIAAAVSALQQAGKDPVPGRVGAKLASLAAQRQAAGLAASRQAEIEAAFRFAVDLDADPVAAAVAAKGKEILPAGLRERLEPAPLREPGVLPSDSR